MGVLITGGAGFIGSHLARALLKRGERVVVIDDFNDFYDPAVKRENAASLAQDRNFKLYEADIRDKAGIERVIRDESPEYVCHLAARAGVGPSIEDPILYEEVNCLGTLNILESIKNLKLKNFVFASSSSVYGEASKAPFSEEDPVGHPISPYAATKRAGELMMFTYSHLYALPVTCLRFFTVYGESGRPDMAVARFTEFIDQGEPVPVYGDGTIKRDFTYVGDIVNGIIGSIYTPFRYEIINLGNAHTIELIRLISIIEAKLGKKAEINFLPGKSWDVPITFADVSKAKRLIGFEPVVSLEEGIERYVKWYLSRSLRTAR